MGWDTVGKSVIGSRCMARWFWVSLRIVLLAIAYVLHPYFVNNIQVLNTWIAQQPSWIPPVLAILCAIAFLLIPEIGKLSPQPEEDLRQKFWALNQKIITKRLKDVLDQDRYIPIASTSSLDHINPLPDYPELAPVIDIRTKRELTTYSTGNVETLQRNKPILEVFEEADHRLLILGEPGSGKTTELLKLAEALGKAAKTDPDAPIPVILELSTWRGEPMVDWIGAEIQARFGIQRKIVKEWLHLDHLVPLLDGLDELGIEQAREAIKAINQLQRHNSDQQKHLVVCSRVQDYQDCGVKLVGVDQEVRLCDLEDEKIEVYLKERKAGHLWQDLKKYPLWMNLARRPMLLNLMPIAFEKPKPLPFVDSEDEAMYQAVLFEEFLACKLTPLDTSPPFADVQQARHYLAWLAAKLEGVGEREFLIEGLQPYWLENQKQWQQYRLIVELIVGLISGLINGLIGGFIVGSILGLISGLVGNLIFGGEHTLQLTEALDLSWKKIKRSIKNAVHYGLIGGLIGGLIVWLIDVLILGVIDGLTGWQLIFALVHGLNRDLTIRLIFNIETLIVGIIGGVITGLVGGVIFGLKAELKVRDRPNQGIHETAIKICLTMGLAIPLCSLIFIVPVWAVGQTVDLGAVLIKGIAIGVLLAFGVGGGIGLVQHFALRWVLYRAGRMPWNYAKFLNTASEQGILKRSGGRYRFYHDKLREHLAHDAEQARELYLEPYQKRKPLLPWGQTKP